jgi:uncharacterized protein YuzE
MKIRYFEDTDTALFEFGNGTPTQTRELSEDVYLDLDPAGNVVSLTLEHASLRSDLNEFSFHRVKGADRAIEQNSSSLTLHG